MRFVAAEKPITTTHAKLGELKIDSPEVPQVESPEEAVTFCGGAEGFLEFFNNAVETAAKNGGRAALRGLADDANLDEAYAKIRDSVRKYAPAQGPREPSKAKKAETYDAISALVNSGTEFTKEQLLELLGKAK